MREPQFLIGETPRRLRRAGKEHGSNFVEAALMLPVLLSMMFGIVGFGHALYTYHFVSNVAREATRWASVRGYTCTLLSGGCPAAATDVQAYVCSVSGMGLNSANITATTTWIAPPNSLAICTTHPNYPGCVVQVDVQYKYHFLFPLLPAPSLTMESASQMIISQ